MADISIYASLFLIALLAATLLPLQSEAVLVGLLLADAGPATTLIAVASLGNILGSIINWKLGQFIHLLRFKPWFPIKEAALKRAEKWFQKYGKWSLLASWMPIIGDPLTMIAGILRVPFLTFLLIISISKISRYVVITCIVLGLFK